MFSHLSRCKFFLFAFTLFLLAPNSWAVDIQISTTDAPNRYTPGLTVSNEYEVVISKAASPGLTVTDIDITIGFSGEVDAISNMTWSCSAPGASSCSSGGAVTSDDDIALTVELAGNNDVTVTITSLTYNTTNTNDLDFDVAIVDPGMIGANANIDGTSNNDDDSDTVDIRDRTDVSINVSDGQAQYIPGTTAQYTINVANSGPNSANNVEITDLALPSGLTISSWSCSAPGGGNSCSPSSGGSTLNTDLDLANGGSAIITVNGNYASDAQTDPLVYEVQARITDDSEYDPDGLTQTASDSNQRAPQADLVVELTTPNSSYSPGDTENYQVVVTNSGPSDVSGVAVIDNTIIDNTIGEFASISWTCVVDSGSSCTSGSGSFNTTADLQSGDSVTYTIAVTYETQASADPLVYTVTATNPNGYDGDSPVSDSKSLALLLKANLTVTLSDGETNYVPGLGGTFTATVTNDGPSNVAGITVIDSNLTEISDISWTCTVTGANSACPAGPVTSAINTTIDLAAGDAAVFTIDVNYLSSANTNPLVYQVIATNPPDVDGTSPATGTDNDNDLDRQVNITVTKESKAGTFVPDEPITYTLVVSNDGPSDLGSAEMGSTPAENVLTLTDVIDGTLANHPTQCNGGTSKPCWQYCPSDLGVVYPNASNPDEDAISPDFCPGFVDVPNISASADNNFTLEVPIHLKAGNKSEIRIHALVSEASGSDCDPNSTATRELCNTASAVLTGTTTSQTGTPDQLIDFVSNEIVIGTDLVVTKTDNLTAAAPGTEISYEIVVRNDGFTDADGVTFNDSLPLYPTVSAGFEPGSISWTCETTDNNACCVTSSTSCGLNSPVTGSGDVIMTSIDLGGQSEVTYTVTGTVSNEASGTISNTASATLPAGIDESDVSNNSATDDDTVLGAETDVAVTKTLESADINTINPDVTDLVYEIVVSNNGPSFADNIDVEDLLDESVLELSTASWSCVIQGTGNCDVTGPVSGANIDTTVDLAVGSTATFLLEVSTIPFSQGAVLNIANVSSSGFDPVSINNSAVVEYALSGESRLRIDNDDALQTATPGTLTNYTIKVMNEGPDNVFGATLENLFPPQLTDVEWTCSAISPIPGDLTFFQSSDQNRAGTNMLLSPDGSHIYISSPDPDFSTPYESRLYVFERNTIPGAEFGEFTFIEFLTHGDDGIDGISSIEEMQMSNDGAYLYVMSSEPDDATGSVATFSRNNNRLSPDYGKLTFLNAVDDEMPVSVVDLLITADQKHLYVTGDDSIVRYARDLGTGLLTHQSTSLVAVAGHLVQSADGANLYVVDEINDQVDAYDRETDAAAPTFGDLTVLNSINQVDIDLTSDMIISGDSRNIYLATTNASKIVVLNRDISTGMISYSTSYDDALLSFNSTETLVGMNHLSISPDGEHLFVSNPLNANPNDGSLLVLSRNSQGLLSKDQKLSSQGMEGLSDVVVSQDGKQVLTTATDGKTLMAFDRRQPDPTFSFVEAEVDQQDDPADSAGEVDGLLGAGAVVVSRDGAHVYVAAIGDNSISAFARDRTKGSTTATRGQHLSFIANYTNGTSGITGILDVNSLAISPNGNFLYAGSRDESTLAVFSRAADGSLSFVNSYSHAANVTDGLLGISDIVVNENSQHLYVVGQFEASVAHYAISASGELTLVNALANGDVGVSGLAGARTLALTPNETHLIVGSGIDDSVVTFSRSLVNGQITFQQNLPGVGDQPMDVAVSPDGEHVYVASANDSRLTVINRNNNAVSAEYGQLTINTSYVDGVNGFNSLLGLRAVVVSPNGEKVYVGAEFDAAVSVLDRDTNPNSASFGRLAVVEVRVDDVDGVDGLNQLYDLAVSRDSKNVYAVGFGDNALTAFVLGEGSSCSAQGSGNISDIVDIGSNGTLTYSVSGKIRSNAVGDLITEAKILPPENFTVDLPLDNCTVSTNDADVNCDQDVTRLIPETDLSISKTNGQLSAIAGSPTQYEIRVSNAGPSDANSSDVERVMVKDILGAGFQAGSVAWSCEAIGSGALSYVGAVVNDISGVEGLSGVSSLAYAANLAGLGPHVIATSVLDNGLLVFAVDEMTGQLTQALPIITASSGVKINGARDVLVIDNDIYVASQVDDSLVAFKAQDNSGLDIQLVENFHFPAINFGLNQAVAVTASSNGNQVYVAGANDDSIVVFGRDVNTGLLTNPTTVSGLNQGLNGVNAIAISDDGYSAYTSGYNDNEIGVYRRDLISGDLTFIEVLDLPAVEFNAVSAISISPDDKHVYVSNAGSNRINVFARDVESDNSSPEYGSLSAVQTIEQGVAGVGGLLMPSAIMVSADGRHVYISSEQSDAVVWFGRNEATGALVFGGIISDLLSSVDGLNGAIDLVSDANGKYLYVAGSQDNGIAILTRSADSFCPASGSGNLNEMVDGQEAGLAVDLAVNGQLIFTVDATVASNASGTLVNEAGVFSCELPLLGSVESCNGSDPNNSNNTALDEDSLNPTADLVITKTDGISVFDGLNSAKQITGNDQFLYVAASQDNAISMFKRETGGGDLGTLTYLGNLQNGDEGVSGLLATSDIILSDDGKTLYAAGTGDNSVVVFKKSSDGQLSYLEKQTSGIFGVTGIEGVSSLYLSADGAHLYATGPLTNSLAVFEVNQTGGPDHGKLTFVQQLQNAVNGVSGLADVSSVLVANDNMHVYVTSQTGNSVSLFLRNPNDASVGFGQLSYLTTYSNDDLGVAGLLGAKAMTMDANAEFLYVLGAVEQALAVFSRDSNTGELTFVEFKQNGTSGVEGLNLARDLFISPDQQNLYVAGHGENALVRFNRDTVDGTLSFVEIIRDGDVLAQPGTFVDGLSGASGLHLTTDGLSLYVVADQDNAIGIFDLDNSSAVPDLGSLTFNDVVINGRGGVAPGSEVTYLIVASNVGPSDAEKVRIVDVFPPEFENVTYQCFPVNGAACNTTVQNSNVNELVDLPQGSSVEILATGILRTDVEGLISNTATIMSSTNPLFAISDPDLTNNTATDNDTVLFVASDLVLNKTNGTDQSVPGDQVSYSITVSNDTMLAGNSVPADVSGVLVTDVVPEAISGVTWTCEAFPVPGLLDDGDGDPLTDNFVSYSDLEQFKDLQFHSNGQLAYAVGQDLSGESLLLVYERNSRSGELEVIQSIVESDVTVAGLAGAVSVALSSDNKQLYVVSDIDDSITTWSIDPIDGTLSFEGKLTDGLGGVNGLGGANDVLVTADGLHVYVAGKADNAIAIFNRDMGTGQLSFNAFLSGVEGLSGIHAMTLSGDYLLVVSEANQSIATFTRSVQNGLLAAADVIQDFELTGSVLDMPRAVSVEGDTVVVASYGSDAVSLFTINRDDGLLTFVDVYRQGDAGINNLEGAEGIAISSSGAEVYVASSVSGAISLFTLKENVLVPSGTVYESALIPDLDGVNQLVINQSGTHLYALSDELVLSIVEKGSSCTESGQGTLNDMANIVSMGYVEYTLNGTILPTATGVLSNTATAVMTGDAAELNPQDNIDTDEDILVPTSDLSVTKDDGLTQVVAGTDLQYDISVFSAGPSAMSVVIEDVLPIFPGVNAGFESELSQWSCTTGRTLQTNGSYLTDGANGLESGNDVIESPDGQFVYVLSELGTLSVFNKDSSGVLTLIQLINEEDELAGGVVTGLSGANAAAIDSQGDNIYIVSSTGNQILVMNRNNATGELDYQQTLTSGSDGIFGMLGPIKVIVSPDDLGVYVAAFESDAIAVFSRDLDTGALLFVERVKDGFGTIVPESNVIVEITDIVMSSDGLYLYTGADFSESISVFARDPNSQVLTFLSVIRAGDLQGGLNVPDMSGKQTLVITNNGDFVYVMAQDSSSLMRFKRNQVDGGLTYEKSITDGDSGVGSMLNPSDIKLTPDGGRLLITDQQNDFISIYDRNTTTGDLTLIDEFYVNVSEDEEVAKPVSITTDGINVYVLLNQQDRLLALRITADAECQIDAEITDVPLIPMYMSPGSAAQIQIDGHVHPSARGTINNVANVILNADSADNNLINNSALDLTEIVVQTDVYLEKTGPSDAVAGEIIEYQIVLTNTGPSDALGVNVQDLFEPTLLNATWTCIATGRSSCENSNGTGSVDESVDVTIDGEVRFTISALIDPGFNGLLVNQANSVVFEAGFNTDTDTSNNSSEVQTTVIQVANLSVLKTNSTTAVVAGEPTSYQITFENNGPSDSPAAAIDQMPDALIDVTWQCTAGPGSNCTLTGQGDINETVYIAANSQIIYQVDGMVATSAMGQLLNEAMVDTITPVSDPELANNISSDIDQINQVADISVSLDDLIDPYDPASPVDLPFNLEVVNMGPSDATNVQVNLPLQLDVTADTVNVCSVSASGVNCDIGYSEAGETHEFVVNYRLNPGLTGEINNLAEATSDTFDPNLSNNSDSTVTTLANGIDVRVIQNNGLEVVEPGQVMTYEITVENIGSVNAGEVTIIEQLPVGLINASWQCEAFDDAVCVNINEPNVTGGAELPAGGRVILTMTATLDPALSDMSQTQISNTVQAIVVNETDYNTLNNTSTLTTPLVFFIFKDGFEGVSP